MLIDKSTACPLWIRSSILENENTVKWNMVLRYSRYMYMYYYLLVVDITFISILQFSIQSTQSHRPGEISSNPVICILIAIIIENSCCCVMDLVCFYRPCFNLGNWNKRCWFGCLPNTWAVFKTVFCRIIEKSLLDWSKWLFF